jgi:hypothetical protein
LKTVRRVVLRELLAGLAGLVGFMLMLWIYQEMGAAELWAGRPSGRGRGAVLVMLGLPLVAFAMWITLLVRWTRGDRSNA